MFLFLFNWFYLNLLKFTHLPKFLFNLYIFLFEWKVSSYFKYTDIGELCCL